MVKDGVGGATTTKNGNIFEELTDLSKALEEYQLNLVHVETRNPDVVVDQNGEVVGYSCKKTKITSFLKNFNINMKDILSHGLVPDEALYIEKDKHMYIFEKKFQSCSGSTDEKLQTCVYKKEAWEAVLKDTVGIEVSYIYVLNDWFKQDRYKSVLDFIKRHGCDFSFNHIPLENIFVHDGAAA